jgi:uncharacterized protein (DUF4415 family)
MEKEKKPDRRGGKRANQTGRPKVDPKKKRLTVSLSISRENIDFLNATGNRNNYLNMMIDKERIDYARFLEATNSLKDAKD